MNRTAWSRGRTGRVVGAAITVALLGGAATACGGDDDKKSDAQPAAEKSAPAKSGLTPAAAIKEAVGKSGKLTSFRYTMDVKVPGEETMQGEAAMSVDPRALSITMEQDGQPVEFRVVGNSIYINGGPEAKIEGKHWMALPMEELNEAAKDIPVGGSAATFAEQSPADQTGMLLGSEDVKKVGTEKIDGVETTHYQGTVSLDELTKSSALDKAQQDEAVKQFKALGIKNDLTMDLYLDADQLTKRMRMQSKTSTGDLDMTITFKDYNKPVTVKKPAASDTADFGKMMEQLKGLGDDAGAEMSDEDMKDLEDALGDM
ncbi:DUF1396 domain-containing protein [Streptomyces sp. SID11385]|uniref:DUF1396 domain-containing protein n=1 Tax=Streptomyces sp. SID11385 TaxID=2706031 RepID=UPI0013CA03E3|nr:DUF1396 domain-containing protein [Streptomyces sp. SID11385]NEA43654.1 DUF1396 domain-containing protein [Streptomyces sp. SID11385]